MHDTDMPDANYYVSHVSRQHLMDKCSSHAKYE